MILTAKAKIAGIIGWPVGHSRSPLLHNHWLNLYGIDGAYIPMPVHPDHLGQAIRALPALNFRGANITIPFKQAVMAYLDEIDPKARRLKSVNTLVVRDDGSIWGTSTDGQGFVDSLLAQYQAFDFTARPVTILGAGGAARAIIAALLDQGVPEIRVVNRTIERIAGIQQDLDDPRILPANDAGAALDGAGLLINSTALGMTGQSPLELDLTYLAPDAMVADIVYAPLETDLLVRAKARGNPVLGGIGMLLYQARAGFNYWFGAMPDVTAETARIVLEGK
jgi:shikimate dehydrogenase